jgi:hypothetical protein
MMCAQPNAVSLAVLLIVLVVVAVSALSGLRGTQRPAAPGEPTSSGLLQQKRNAQERLEEVQARQREREQAINEQLPEP